MAAKMRYGLRPGFPVQHGAHAEVQGITSRIGGSRGILVVSWPGGKVRTVRLARTMNVQSGMRFAGRFNARCEAER